MDSFDKWKSIIERKYPCLDAPRYSVGLVFPISANYPFSLVHPSVFKNPVTFSFGSYLKPIKELDSLAKAHAQQAWAIETYIYCSISRDGMLFSGSSRKYNIGYSFGPTNEAANSFISLISLPENPNGLAREIASLMSRNFPNSWAMKNNLGNYFS